MTLEIDNIKTGRKFLLELIRDLSTEQLNEIPSGFNNNISWHLGHLIAAQQRICYLRSGIELAIGIPYLSDYLPGTKPVNFISSADIQTMKDLFLSMIDLFKEDYSNGLFSMTTYSAFVSPYGIPVNNLEEAIRFVFYHEGLHTGYVMAQQRVLKR